MRSYTVTASPARASTSAAMSPDGPPPTTATRGASLIRAAFNDWGGRMRPATRRSAERHQQVEVVCGASGPGREREGPLAEVAAGAAVAPEADPVRFVAAGAPVGPDAHAHPVDGSRSAALVGGGRGVAGGGE